MNERVDIIHEIFSNGAPVAFFLVMIICITWIINTVIRSMRQRANVRTRAELYRQMIDRFGAAPEFIAFLQSDTGQKFIEENVHEAGPPHNKILGSIQIGVIATLLGPALFVLGIIFGGDVILVTSIVGTVALALGIGFLILAAIRYKLCTRWGVVTVKEK